MEGGARERWVWGLGLDAWKYVCTYALPCLAWTRLVIGQELAAVLARTRRYRHSADACYTTPLILQSSFACARGAHSTSVWSMECTMYTTSLLCM